MSAVDYDTPRLCNKVAVCHDGAAEFMAHMKQVLETAGKKGHYEGLIAVLQEYRQGLYVFRSPCDCLTLLTVTISAMAEDVVSYVSKVLGPYPALAAEFNEFLPEGISLSSKTNRKSTLCHRTSRRENVQSSALRFMSRIRATDTRLRDPFCVALGRWKQGESGLGEVSSKLSRSHLFTHRIATFVDVRDCQDTLQRPSRPFECFSQFPFTLGPRDFVRVILPV